MSLTSTRNYAGNADSDLAPLPVDVNVHDAITALQPEVIEPQIEASEVIEPQRIAADSSGAIPSEQIAAEAYALYVARGCEDGHDVEDWLAAEALIRRRRTSN